jgi:hypothetical protein
MIALLVERYLGGSAVKQLAAEFGVHRTTVASVLQRQDIKLRQVGLNEDQVEEACALYRNGWAVGRLGQLFGVDGTTVWRYLLLAEDDALSERALIHTARNT